MICQHTHTLINTHSVEYFYSRPFKTSWWTVILSQQVSYCTNLSHICFQAAASSCLRFCPLWHKILFFKFYIIQPCLKQPLFSPSCLCRIPQHSLMFVLVRSKRAKHIRVKSSCTSDQLRLLLVVSSFHDITTNPRFLIIICNYSRRQARAHMKLRSMCCHASSCCRHLCDAH